MSQTQSANSMSTALLRLATLGQRIFLQQRIGDGVILRLINKWLKAGEWKREASTTRSKFNNH